MSFPRSFKRETWFVRLQSGDTEVSTGDDIERAWKAGLVDVRTPVRLSSIPVWTTLADAAKLDAVAIDGQSSLSPMAMSESLPPNDAAAPWRSGTYLDDAAIQGQVQRRLQALGAIACIAAIACGAFLGYPGKAASASAAAAKSTMMAAPLPISHLPFGEEEVHHSERVVGHAARLTAEQEKRLLDADAVRRWKAAVSHQEAKKQADVERRARRASDPIFAGGNPHDPLNGAL